MKIETNYLHEAQEADKREDARRSSKLRRMYNEQPLDAANKSRHTDSPVKEELKFASVLENSAKLQKTGRQQDEASRDGENGSEKKDKKHASKDSADNLTGETMSDKYESFSGGGGGGGNFGGQSGFGGEINQLHLSENFAARSILHIADLERLVSIIRSQTALGGRREIVLQLKRSVLEGLRVKITTDSAAQVGIEFFAANQSVRSQIEKHSDELSAILRGRGINLQSLVTNVYRDEENQNSFSSEENKSARIEPSLISTDDDFLDDNTFNSLPAEDGRKYTA